MRKKTVNYDFCPECGSLLRNGICHNCGYAEPETADRKENTGADGKQQSFAYPEGFEGTTQDNGQASTGGSPAAGAEMQERPRKNNQYGVIAALAGGCAVFAALLCVAVFMIVNDLDSYKYRLPSKTPDKSVSVSPQGESEGQTGGDESEYIPSAEDEYYIRLTDYYDDTLSYGIEWEQAVNEKEDVSCEVIYPRLCGDIPALEELNASIEELALSSKEFCEDYAKQEEHRSLQMQVFGYVTWMDENIVSIVFQEELTVGLVTISSLADMNIDIRTGTLLSHRDMIKFSDGLAAAVKRQNKVQNDSSQFTESKTDEEIRELLEGYNGIVFFTPAGLEIGFNYDGSEMVYGWVTVTLKNYQKYMKED